MGSKTRSNQVKPFLDGLLGKLSALLTSPNTNLAHNGLSSQINIWKTFCNCPRRIKCRKSGEFQFPDNLCSRVVQLSVRPENTCSGRNKQSLRVSPQRPLLFILIRTGGLVCTKVAAGGHVCRDHKCSFCAFPYK